MTICLTLFAGRFTKRRERRGALLCSSRAAFMRGSGFTVTGTDVAARLF